MANQLTTNADALRLFFTEDVYLVKNEAEELFEPIVKQNLESPVNEGNATTTVGKIIFPPAPISGPPAAELPKKTWNFEYLGKNQKSILILVNDSENKVSSSNGNLLLRKLVDAIGLANNDFALVNYASYATAKFEDLNGFFNFQLLLAFGVEAEVLGLAPHSQHQLHHFGTTKMIFTANLHALDSDLASKQVLWSTLKKLK